MARSWPPTLSPILFFIFRSTHSVFSSYDFFVFCYICCFVYFMKSRLLCIPPPHTHTHFFFPFFSSSFFRCYFFIIIFALSPFCFLHFFITFSLYRCRTACGSALIMTGLGSVYRTLYWLSPYLPPHTHFFLLLLLVKLGNWLACSVLLLHDSYGGVIVSFRRGPSKGLRLRLRSLYLGSWEGREGKKGWDMRWR